MVRTWIKAFTLIELLVVVAIIAVLVSILLPALQQARNASQKTVCLANWHNVGVATGQYLMDNHEKYFPTHWNDWRVVWDWDYPPAWPEKFFGFGRLLPYVPAEWLGRVPSDKRGILSCPGNVFFSDPTFANVLYVLPFSAATAGPGSLWQWPPELQPGESATTVVGICFVNGNPWDYRYLTPGSHAGEGVNAVYPDGHAGWVPASKFVDASPETNNPWIKLKLFNGD